MRRTQPQQAGGAVQGVGRSRGAEEQGSRGAGRSRVDLRSVISRRDEIEEKIEKCLQGKLDSFLSMVEKMVEDKGEGKMR